MPESSRFVFCVNAAAGTGRGPRRLEALLEARPALRARARVVASASPGALDAALRLADDEIPVAVGGDGSLNALVTLLSRRGELQRTLGLVPFGTGNATAHTLGLRSTEIALAALERGHAVPVDLMRTGIAAMPIALVSCSTGFESLFLQRYSALRYQAKLWAGLSALALNAPRHITGVSLTLDGAAFVAPATRVHNVGLYGIPHYAFGKVMWRGLQRDDGLGIAAEVTNTLSYWHLMARGAITPSTDTGSAPALPGVRTACWRTATLRSPVPLQVDGEATSATVAELEIVERALRVIGV